MSDERAQEIFTVIAVILLLCWGGWWLWTHEVHPPASHVCIDACAQQAEQFDRDYECSAPPADSSANEADNQALARQQQEMCGLPALP